MRHLKEHWLAYVGFPFVLALAIILDILSK